jgi:hypothetical protein
VPAEIKTSEVRWHEPVIVRFGIYGLTHEQTKPIIRDLIGKNWPTVRRTQQCVYVIRVRGAVAIAYGDKHSPVIYIGEGNAFKRLYGHAFWISTLLLSVPNIEVEIHIAEIARKNNGWLYKSIEADMIKWFVQEFGCLPWFNKQRERGKEEHYSYDPAAESLLRRHIGVGSGNKFLWAIRPLPNNDQFSPYSKG